MYINKSSASISWYTNTYVYILVGGFDPSEKIWVHLDDYSQYVDKMTDVTNHQPVYMYKHSTHVSWLDLGSMTLISSIIFLGIV